jgi:hypothetical protein
MSGRQFRATVAVRSFYVPLVPDNFTALHGALLAIAFCSARLRSCRCHETQNPHPCRFGARIVSAFQNAARMGHPRTCGLSCRASSTRVLLAIVRGTVEIPSTGSGRALAASVVPTFRKRGERWGTHFCFAVGLGRTRASALHGTLFRQQVPGFLVGAVLGFGEVRGEDDYGLVVGGADGEDVPGVGGDYQGGEEVQLVGGVDDVAGADGAGVGVAALVDGAFDPFVAVAPQGRLWTRRKWPWWSVAMS